MGKWWDKRNFEFKGWFDHVEDPLLGIDINVEIQMLSIVARGLVKLGETLLLSQLNI
jgi:hypothetical protein